jgi:hypothetical protein
VSKDPEYFRDPSTRAALAQDDQLSCVTLLLGRYTGLCASSAEGG